MRVPHHVTTLLLVTAICVAGVFKGEARAWTGINPPWGSTTAVQAQLGKDINGTGVWLDWKNRATGACTSTYMGQDNALTDDFSVYLSTGNDIFYISFNTFGQNICGYGALVKPRFGAHYVDVAGNDGNDYIQSGLDVDESWVYADGGAVNYLRDDWPGAWIVGSGGNDTLATGATGTSMSSGDGMDCLESYTDNAALFDCGTGSDLYSKLYHPSNVTNCELPTPDPFCPLTETGWPY